MSVTACPACVGADLAIEHSQAIAAHTKRSLSLPEIRCAACIQGVERILMADPNVSRARVNFGQKRVTVWADPDVSNECLAKVLNEQGFNAYPLNLERLGETRKSDLPMRIGVSGFALMNVMLLSVAVWSGATDATRDLFHLISACIAVPATLYGAMPFLKSALTALKAARMNMDVPISLAIILALVMSVYESLASGHHAYFDAALSLTFFLLIGRYLDQLMKRAARSAAKELAALDPDKVTIVVDGQLHEIQHSQLAQGDLLFLKTGSRLPADGVLVRGDSLLDTSYVTGESDPQQSQAGQMLAAGVINLTGPIWVRAKHVGQDSSLHQMAEMISQAETARNKYTGLADKAAQIYAPLVHVLAFIAFIGWMIATQDLRISMNVAIAVLIITCPCALGLAVPAVATLTNTRLFKMGVVLKGENALERLANIDTVVFDKTGTLSRTSFDPSQSQIPDKMLEVLKALSDCSSHPFARAISDALSGKKTAQITDIKEEAGFGIRAKLGKIPIELGAGKDVLGQPTTLFRFGSDCYPISFDERPFDWSAPLVETLKIKGFKTVLLSGDKSKNVERVNAILKCDLAYAELSPLAKAERVSQMQANGDRVLMIGDGLNDGAALAVADASLAPCHAIDVSRAVADVLVLGDDLTPITKLLTITAYARRLMFENFLIAAVYNLVAIPVAVMGFATPLIAAIAMSVSSITVIANSMRGGEE